MLNILKDIRSGALPAHEIPGFILWGIGKSFWFWLVLIAGAAVGFWLG